MPDQGVPNRLILTADPASEAAALADLRRILSRAGSGADLQAPAGNVSYRLSEAGSRPASTRRSRLEELTPVRLAPGVLLLPLPCSYRVFTESLRAHPPIFIRHFQPAQR